MEFRKNGYFATWRKSPCIDQMLDMRTRINCHFSVRSGRGMAWDPSQNDRLCPRRENALRASATVPLRSCCTVVLALVDYLRLLQHSTVGDNPPSVVFLHWWIFTTIAKVIVNRNLFFFNSDASLATVALILDFHTKVAWRKTAWTSYALFYISYVLSDAFEAIFFCWKLFFRGVFITGCVQLGCEVSLTVL